MALALVFAAAAAAEPSPGASRGHSDVLERAPQERGGGRTVVTPRNDVKKDAGETAGLADPTGEEIYFEIVIDAVAIVETCPGRLGPQESENGSFLVLDLEASLSERIVDLFAPGDDLFMPLVAQSFTVLDEGGNVVEGVLSESAWLCFDEADLVKPFIGPGEHAAGHLVLDSPVTSGSIVYDPAGDGGWEWPFGE